VAAARLILASASPQRREILTQIGVAFDVRVSGAEELEAGPPVEVAMENAHRKAAAVADAGASAPAVLGVDTVVSLGQRIFGKPADAEAARGMLCELSGRRHIVVSGLCLIEGDRTRTAAAETVVEFRALTGAEVDAYVATEEWRGRAGGYAIQGRGATIVRRIEGDYLNVVGLPVALLVDMAPGLVGRPGGPGPPGQPGVRRGARPKSSFT
jgi:septum formation protein